MSSCVCPKPWGGVRRWVLGVLACLTLVGSAAWADERVAATLTVEDVLAFPGTRVPLKTRLFHQNTDSERIGLAKETIEFFVQGRLIGEVETGETGEAVLEFVPRLRGNLTVKVRVRGSARVEEQEAEGLLAAWEKRRPILLVDVEALLPISETPAARNAGGHTSNGSAPLPTPETAARPELDKLGKFYYNILYLQRSPKVSREVLRGWLRAHKLPIGMPMVIAPGAEALIGFLEQLKNDGWENVEAGIGKTAEFAHVLVERRVTTVILQESAPREKFPRRTHIVDGWKQVRRHL